VALDGVLFLLHSDEHLPSFVVLSRSALCSLATLQLVELREAGTRLDLTPPCDPRNWRSLVVIVGFDRAVPPQFAAQAGALSTPCFPGRDLCRCGLLAVPSLA
jgi:hypothetical protein